MFFWLGVVALYTKAYYKDKCAGPAAAMSDERFARWQSWNHIRTLVNLMNFGEKQHFLLHC